MTWIQTHTNHAFDFTSDDNTVEPIDVAYALGHIFRFNGHTEMTVAQHCVRVSELVEQRVSDASDQLLLAALLHDAHEAFVGDMVTPLKRTMPDAARAWWDGMCERVDRAVARAFGLRDPSLMHHEAVKQADLVMLATERRDLLGPAPRPWLPLPDPHPLTAITLDPVAASSRFLLRWQELSGHTLRCPRCGSLDTFRPHARDLHWKLGTQRCRRCRHQADWMTFVQRPRETA